jgi:hypothetical protein
MLKLKNPFENESKITDKGCLIFMICQFKIKLSPQRIPIIKKEIDKRNTAAKMLMATL